MASHNIAMILLLGALLASPLVTAKGFDFFFLVLMVQLSILNLLILFILTLVTYILHTNKRRNMTCCHMKFQ